MSEYRPTLRELARMHEAYITPPDYPEDDVPYGEPGILVVMHDALKAMRQAREIVTLYGDALAKIASETSDPRAGAHADAAIKAAAAIVKEN